MPQSPGIEMTLLFFDEVFLEPAGLITLRGLIWLLPYCSRTAI
jgi:hypothetical protein